MIKAIIFDWFGVCAEEFTKSISDGLQKILGKNSKLIIKSYKKRELQLILGKMNSETVLRSMFKEFNADNNINDYLYIFNSVTTLNDCIFILIKNLKSEYKTALLSDNFNEMTNAIRKKINLNVYFDVAVFSNEVGLVKRENKIYKFVLGKLKCKSEDCILVDDKIENIQRAGKFGIKGVLYKNVRQLKKDLIRHNVKIV
ncbi:HAD-IA family hydrolase [Candidatus Woesearchaeota archaeon]|nr:HAD-IA family hydrolase [Candidatus Woesearchaeota archaeon]